MTFPKVKKPINVEKLSEVSNDNHSYLKVGEDFFLTSDKSITVKKKSPERKLPDYIEDEWDNIHGDIINF
jgi:hypothetical protein